MTKKKQSFGVVNIGTTSLLVVFLTLCLVTFAILTLSTAKSDYKFSQKLAEKTTCYYEENNARERALEMEDFL